MAEYNGMRWLKCDLHMHTPAGACGWQGDKIEPDHEQEAAEQFARACYESGLDIIGVTDHNFTSKDFISHVKTALEDLATEFGRHITMFPGFEFEADVGKGMHVVCLFEPNADFDEIDHILTECGVDYNRVSDGTPARSTKRLPDILDVVQKPDSSGRWRGLVIVPHVFEDSLFDGDRISDWLQKEEYLNPNSPLK